MKKLSTWYRKLRIEEDLALGWTVKVWRIWFPFWIELRLSHGGNTFETQEEARKWAEQVITKADHI